MAPFNMERRPTYRNLSPLDHRYWETNSALYERLADYLSEEAATRYCARVEAALARAHMQREGVLTSEIDSALLSAAEQIDPTDVAEEEQKTQHNIRALVNVYQKMLPETARPYVHLGATSVDVLDTATSMRYRDVVRSVLVPLLRDVAGRLCELAEAYADTVQIGRTHGQFAVPITFGFAIGEYAARLSKSIVEIDRLASELRGKIAGAVGAYNALAIATNNPAEFEKEVLGDLGLRSGDQSNQLVEPEYQLRLLLECNTAFGILANLADDMRNLQRSEISEVREAFDSSQVGSSTMPHKRNPWNWEHIKSLWKAFVPRVVTFYMDQISEHQRDLTNSASSRFVAEYFAGFAAAFNRAKVVLKRIEPDRERMLDNIERAGDMCLAEPAYILLSLAGMEDAHERVRVATLAAGDEQRKLVDVLRRDRVLWDSLEAAAAKRLQVEASEFFSDPKQYVGIAAEKARQSAATARKRLGRLNGDGAADERRGQSIEAREES